MKRKLTTPMIGTILMVGMLTTGCNQADRVSQNLSQEADNFNVVRQLTVINSIQGDVLFQMTGKMSIKVDPAEQQLEIVVENNDGGYSKHFVGISDNTSYVVEQLSTKHVDKYQYAINFNPKMWIPVQPEIID